MPCNLSASTNMSGMSGSQQSTTQKTGAVRTGIDSLLKDLEKLRSRYVHESSSNTPVNSGADKTSQVQDDEVHRERAARVRGFMQQWSPQPSPNKLILPFKNTSSQAPESDTAADTIPTAAQLPTTPRAATTLSDADLDVTHAQGPSVFVSSPGESYVISHSNTETGADIVVQQGGASQSSGNNWQPLADMNFGAAHVKVSGPPMHQRIDVYSDGSVATLHTPVASHTTTPSLNQLVSSPMATPQATQITQSVTNSSNEPLSHEGSAKVELPSMSYGYTTPVASKAQHAQHADLMPTPNSVALPTSPNTWSFSTPYSQQQLPHESTFLPIPSPVDTISPLSLDPGTQSLPSTINKAMRLADATAGHSHDALSQEEEEEDEEEEEEQHGADAVPALYSHSSNDGHQLATFSTMAAAAVPEEEEAVQAGLSTPGIGQMSPATPALVSSMYVDMQQRYKHMKRLLQASMNDSERLRQELQDAQDTAAAARSEAAATQQALQQLQQQQQQQTADDNHDASHVPGGQEGVKSDGVVGYAERHQDVVDQLREAQDLIQDLQDKVNAAQQDQDRIKSQDEQLTALQALVASKAQDLGRLQDVADANADRAVALGGQLDQALQENQTLRAGLQTQASEIEREVQSLRASASQQQVQLQEVKAREASAITEAQHAQQAAAETEQKLREVEGQLVEVSEKLEQSEAAVQELQERFDELSNEAEEELAEQTQQLGAQHAKGMENLTERHRVALDEMEQGHQALVAALEERYQMRVAAMQVEHRQAQEQVESQHAQQQQQLESRIEELLMQMQTLSKQVHQNEARQAVTATHTSDEQGDSTVSPNTPVLAQAPDHQPAQHQHTSWSSESHHVAYQTRRNDVAATQQFQPEMNALESTQERKVLVAHDDGPASARPTRDHDVMPYPGLISRSSRESVSSYYSQEQLSHQVAQVQIQLADLEIQLAGALEDLGNENERARKLEELLAAECNKSWLLLQKLNAVEEERDGMKVRLEEQRALLEAASKAAHTQASSLATQLDTLAVTWERERGGLAEQLQACQQELEVSNRKLMEAERSLLSERQAAQQAAMQQDQLMEALTTAQQQITDLEGQLQDSRSSAEQQSHIHQAQVVIPNLESRLAAAQQQSQHTQQLLVTAEEHRKVAAAKCDELHHELRAATRRSLDLLQQVDVLEQQLVGRQQCEQVIVDVSGTANTRSVGNDNDNYIRSTLQQQPPVQEVDIGSKQPAYDVLKANCDELQAQLASEQHALRRENESAEAARAELRSVSRQILSLQSQIRDLESAGVEQVQPPPAVAAVSHQDDDLNHELVRAKSALNQEVSQSQDLRSQLTSSSRQIQALQRQVAELDEQVGDQDTLEEKCAELEVQVEELKAELETAHTTAQQDAHLAGEVQTQLGSASQQILSLQQQLQESEKRMSEQDVTISNLRNIQQLYASLQSQFEVYKHHTREQHAQMKGELHEALISLQMSSSQLLSMQQAIIYNSHAEQDLASGINSVMHQADAAAQDAASFVHHIQRLRNENDELIKDLQAEQQAVDALKQELRQKQLDVIQAQELAGVMQAGAAYARQQLASTQADIAALQRQLVDKACAIGPQPADAQDVPVTPPQQAEPITEVRGYEKSDLEAQVLEQQDMIVELQQQLQLRQDMIMELQQQLQLQQDALLELQDVATGATQGWQDRILSSFEELGQRQDERAQQQARLTELVNRLRVAAGHRASLTHVSTPLCLHGMNGGIAATVDSVEQELPQHDGGGVVQDRMGFEYLRKSLADLQKQHESADAATPAKEVTPCMEHVEAKEHFGERAKGNEDKLRDLQAQHASHVEQLLQLHHDVMQQVQQRHADLVEQLKTQHEIVTSQLQQRVTFLDAQLRSVGEERTAHVADQVTAQLTELSKKLLATQEEAARAKAAEESARNRGASLERQCKALQEHLEATEAQLDALQAQLNQQIDVAGQLMLDKARLEMKLVDTKREAAHRQNTAAGWMEAKPMDSQGRQHPSSVNAGGNAGSSSACINDTLPAPAGARADQPYHAADADKSDAWYVNSVLTQQASQVHDTGNSLVSRLHNRQAATTSSKDHHVIQDTLCADVPVHNTTTHVAADSAPCNATPSSAQHGDTGAAVLPSDIQSVVSSLQLKVMQLEEQSRSLQRQLKEVDEGPLADLLAHQQAPKTVPPHHHATASTKASTMLPEYNRMDRSSHTQPSQHNHRTLDHAMSLQQGASVAVQRPEDVTISTANRQVNDVQASALQERAKVAVSRMLGKATSPGADFTVDRRTRSRAVALGTDNAARKPGTTRPAGTGAAASGPLRSSASGAETGRLPASKHDRSTQRSTRLESARTDAPGSLQLQSVAATATNGRGDQAATGQHSAQQQQHKTAALIELDNALKDEVSALLDEAASRCKQVQAVEALLDAFDAYAHERANVDAGSTAESFKLPDLPASLHQVVSDSGIGMLSQLQQTVKAAWLEMDRLQALLREVQEARQSADDAAQHRQSGDKGPASRPGSSATRVGYGAHLKDKLRGRRGDEGSQHAQQQTHWASKLSSKAAGFGLQLQRAHARIADAITRIRSLLSETPVSIQQESNAGIHVGEQGSHAAQEPNEAGTELHIHLHSNPVYDQPNSPYSSKEYSTVIMDNPVLQMTRSGSRQGHVSGDTVAGSSAVHVHGRTELSDWRSHLAMCAPAEPQSTSNDSMRWSHNLSASNEMVRSRAHAHEYHHHHHHAALRGSHEDSGHAALRTSRASAMHDSPHARLSAEHGALSHDAGARFRMYAR